MSYDPRLWEVLVRVSESFDIDMPQSVATVGDLVSYVATARKITPATEIRISRYPSRLAIFDEARRLLLESLKSLHWPTPSQSDDSLEHCIPKQNRAMAWRELGRSLNIDLEPLLPNKMTYGTLFVVTYLLTQYPLVLICRSLEDATTILGYTAIILSAVAMWFVSLYTSAAVAGTLATRNHIPYEHTYFLVQEISRQKSSEILRRLRVEQVVVVSEFVHEIVSESFNVPRSDVTPSFSLE